jgi:hypothetical protein
MAAVMVQNDDQGLEARVRRSDLFQESTRDACLESFRNDRTLRCAPPLKGHKR